MTEAEQIQAYLARKALSPNTNKSQSVKIRSISLPTRSTCQYLGEVVPGGTCGARLYKCKKFDEITTQFVRCEKATRHCATCKIPDEEKYPTPMNSATTLVAPPPTNSENYSTVNKRHLIYHVLPVSQNGVWRKGIDQLRLRWNLFNGRKIISVATGGHIQERIDKAERVSNVIRMLPLESALTVKKYLPKDAEVIEVSNDPNTWESPSWKLLWKSVLETADYNDAILYCHAKGVTRKITSSCHVWTDMLYSLSLDHWDIVNRILQTKPVVGSLIKRGPYFGGVLSHSRWHYSGNFWWTRAGVIKERLDKYPLPIDRWATEAWVGMGFHISEAGNIFSPRKAIAHLYSPTEMQQVVAEYDTWLNFNPPTIFQEKSSIVTEQNEI